MSKLWIVVGGLLIIIVVMLLLWPKPDNSKRVDFERREKERKEENARLTERNVKLQAKIDSDSLRFTKAIQDGQVTILKQGRRISDLKANPEVVTIIAENPLIGELINSYDSLVSQQAEQIELQGKYIDTLRVDMHEIRENFAERLELQAQTIADLTVMTEDQRKQLRKTRRSVTALKVVAIIGTVGGLFLGGQL